MCRTVRITKQKLDWQNEFQVSCGSRYWKCERRIMKSLLFILFGKTKEKSIQSDVSEEKPQFISVSHRSPTNHTFWRKTFEILITIQRWVLIIINEITLIPPAFYYHMLLTLTPTCLCFSWWNFSISATDKMNML